MSGGRMRSSTINLVHIAPEVWLKNQHEITAQALHGDTAVLGKSELRSATAAALLQDIRNALEQCEGQPLTGAAIATASDDPNRARLLLALANDWWLVSPGLLKDYL